MEEEIVPITLQVSVFETILVSELIIVGIIVGRITTWDFSPKKGEAIVSVAEYRQILGDSSSSEKDITKRLQYLEAFCANIIKPELQIYVSKQQK
jgi:hypothetical protein